MDWTLFVEDCVAIWGNDWEAQFLAAAKLSRRTLSRWRKRDRADTSGLVAMLDAFKRCRRYGIALPTEAP